MTQNEMRQRNKGGRPSKEIRKNIILTLKCSAVEKMIIAQKARESNQNISEYIREICINGQADRRVKVLPPEVLAFSGTLNHIAANINQIAWKRNKGENLSLEERGNLQRLVSVLKEIAVAIKNYLR
ncbi:plasmid mobilization protein [Chitinophaga sp. 22321]|uniref:Mobilization protein n=1 Tax=Chitinophaga hostae TaxID=2831022 RepID=A0ABS5IXL6_9BACT|nr:mobilization protein [Chitinophaga hostae]MBS0027708.1 mobilization protein [Chitinophaga hostae]